MPGSPTAPGRPSARVSAIRDFALQFMEKAKNEGKPFFVWLNPTRMHVYTHVSQKYEALKTPGIRVQHGRGGYVWPSSTTISARS
jgi:hypothetical protein